MNINFYISICLSIFLVACGGGGGGGGSEPPTPTTPAPTISFSANPTSVLLGTNSTLTWSSSNATSCSASGNWSGSRSTSGSETVTINGIGNNSFTLSCSGGGGSRSATVTVEGFRQTDGVVVDGYISGADVFIDQNDNFIADASEDTTTSDNEGKFTIKYNDGNLVSIGGTDLDSQTLLDNLLITHKLSGHSEFKAITPVTSVAAFMNDPSNINTALGIDNSLDIYVTDPVANKGDAGIYDYLYEKGNQLTVLAYAIQNISNDLNVSTDTTEDYFKGISEELENLYNESGSKVDIETSAFIEKVFDNITAAKSLNISENSKNNSITALASVLPIIQVKSDPNITTSIIRFGVSKLQQDIILLANGSASQELINNYTQNVTSYIAENENISESDLIPDITSFDDLASTDEDTPLNIFILENDSYVAGNPFLINPTNPSNGSIQIIDRYILYTPNQDFNGSDQFSYTLSQGDKASNATVSIDVLPVNDTPSIDIASTIQVYENQTNVTTVSVSDVDEDELTLTLTDDLDGASFNLSESNVLTFIEAPDYETKTSYQITLSLTDNIETVTKDVTIEILDLNDGGPIFISNSTFSVDENTKVIGQVTAEDPEGETVIYSISGSDIIIAESGAISFIESPDFETKNVYTATVTASDGTISNTQDITVNINNLNDNSPEITSSNQFFADENQTAIGTVFASDADGDTIEFSISSETIQIDKDTGVLTFVNPPDFEQTPGFSYDVTVSDGTFSTTQEIIITINNLNDTAPKIEISGPFTVDEYVTGDTNYKKVNGVITVDDGDGSSLTVTISDANLVFNPGGSNAYGCSGGSCNLELYGKFLDTFDYEKKSSWIETLTVTDEDYTTTKEIVITVNNINDNAPSIISSTIFNADEGQRDIGRIEATDADGDDLSYSISSGGEITINPTSGFMRFASTPDYETQSSYSASVTVSDGSFSTTQDITINVNNIDNENTPVITSSSTFNADENQTNIGTVFATDADGDDLTFSISGSEITITGSTASEENGDWPALLSFVSAPDYETKSSYSATITVSDGTYSSSQDITININDIDENPPILSNLTATPSTVDVTSESQTITLSITATDETGVDVSQFLSKPQISKLGSPSISADANWALVSGDNKNGTYQATITISTDAAVGDYLINAGFIYDLKGNDARLVTDYGAANGGVTINSSQEGDPPVLSNLTATPSTIDITSGAQSITLSISATDASGVDVSQFLSKPQITSQGGTSISANANWSLVSGDDKNGTYQAIVSIPSNTPVGDYLINSGFIYDIFGNSAVEVSDYGASNGGITIKTNTAPVITSSSSFNADENQTAIGTVTASDADGDIIIFSISGSEISIDSSTGVLTFISAPDYETKSSYSATVTVSDGVASETQNITVTINDIDENTNSPVITSEASFNADENQTAIGTVTATDADGDDIAFSISGSEISIGETSGILTFLSSPDYETKSSYSATVTASDGSFSSSQNITVSVNNLNDNSPIISSNPSFTIEENQSTIGTLEASDGDGDPLSYSINNDVQQKIIVTVAANNNGSGNVYVIREVQKKSLTLEVGKTYKFEHPSGHPLRFSATSDGIHAGGSEYTTGVDTSQNGVTLLTISANTPTNLYYYCRIHSGMGGAITASSEEFPEISISDQGILSFDPTPDFESLASFSAKATVSDGVNSIDQDIQVDITDIDQEGPTFSSESTFTIDENTTEVGTISASDPFGSSVTYSLSGTDAESFNLNQDSGVLVFKTAPDYETKSSYQIVVTAVGGAGSTEQTVSIVINNLNDNSPSITSSNTFSADENQTSIGSIVAADADGDSISYSISSNDILIDPNNGLMVFSSSPDYEITSSYSGIVTVSDGENSSSQVITVSINNLNDNDPVFTSSATFSINENELSVATVTATDADNDEISFIVSGSDLSITTSGVLTFNSAPDFESQSTYSATVTASDGLNTAQQTINISVVDVNEAPQITSNSSFTIDENETAIGTVTGSDQDGDSFTFTISGSEINIGETSGVLTFASAPDYETKSSYTASVTINDGSLSSSQNITIDVNNLNDNDPVITSSESFSADENQTAIGTVEATDADNDDITFSISGSEINIGETTGVLTFASAPDYETKSSYTATVTASDGTNNSTQSITVSVNDLNDSNPYFSGLGTNTINIIEEHKLEVILLQGRDEDTAGSNIIWTLSGADSNSFEFKGAQTGSNYSNNMLLLKSDSDYETKSQYSVSVTLSDGINSTSEDLTINVIDAHDRVGQIIEGTNDYERFGNKVKISGDGKTIIVSSLGPDNQEDYQSKVSIYKLENNSWSLSKTFGPAGNSGGRQGHSIDINDDGNIIAYTHKNDGVYIYEYDGSSQWTQKGSVIKIKTANNSPLLSLNAPGNSILVEEGGDIKVFDYRKSSGSGTDWIQRGDTIQITNFFGESGVSYLALSPDGNAFAISSIDESPSSSSCNGFTAARGVLRVYKWGLDSWSIKDTLSGCDVTTLPSNAYSEYPNIWVYYGYSIDFTSDSKWLLIGSRADYNITWSTNTSGYAYADSGVYQIYNIASNDPKFYGTPLWVADTGGYSYVSDSGGWGATSGGGGLIDWKDSEGTVTGDGGYPRVYIQERLQGEWDCENRACSLDGFSDGTSSWERNALQLSAPNLRQFTFDGSSWSAGEAVVRGDKFNRSEGNIDYSTNISGITNDGSRVIFGIYGSRKCFGTCEEATKGYVDVKDIRASSAPATKFSLDLSEDVTINENGGSIQITTSNGSGGLVVLGGRDAGYFTVNPNNVAGLFFSTNANYEATNYPDGDDRFRLQLSVTDGVYWASKHLNVQIGDINDSPYFTSATNPAVDENQQSVITLAATDEDGDTLTFAIDGGTDASLFTVNSSTGVLTFVSSHTPDYETKTSYSITVSVSDGTATTQQNLTVTINNINDQEPVFTSDATFSTPEFNTTGSGSRTFTIGDVNANDPDGLGSITYSISGNEISIDSSSGVIAFINEADYETKNTYTATVTASDGGLTAQQNITVNVTNSNDNDPVFTSSETFNANENQTAIGTVTATDVDNDTITFTVSGDNLQITSAGVLSFTTAPDYETKNTYTGTVTASDNSTDPVFGARQATQEITVNVQNVDGSVNGTAYSSRFHVIDSDVPNTTNHTSSGNGSVSTAQVIQNPSVIHGHVGGSDGIDVFKVTTSSNMVANLDVVDYVNDSQELRLYIYEADGTSRSFSYTSASVEQNMSILLPSSGTYLLAVDDLNGSSQYILTIGQRFETSSLEVSTDFIPDFISNELMGYRSELRTINELDNSEIFNIGNRTKLIEMIGNRFEGFGAYSFDISNLLNIKKQKDKYKGAGLTEANLEELSAKQINYLNHWSVLQDIKSLSKEIIFDFNYEFELASFTRDPEFYRQWNLQQVQLESALNAVGQDVKNVAVAVIDTGGPTPSSTAWNESNLIDGGFDFMYGDSNSVDYQATSSYSGSSVSHGTHVSTTIAAKNNGTGINGYAVHALNINVFNQNPNKSIRSDSTKVINAILYSAGLSNSSSLTAPNSIPIKVINMSLSSSGNTAYLNALCQSVTDAFSQGVSVVASAGNDQDISPGKVSYPASCSDAISVAATNAAGDISYYSQQNAYVDIAAPGGGATDLDGDGQWDHVLAYGDDSSLKAIQGTSMAGPQAAAAIALMYASDSNMSPSKVITMLEAGELSDDAGASGRDNAFGYGILNVAKALNNTLNDIGDPTTYAYLSLPYLDYGTSTTELAVDLIKVGTGSLSVSSLSADDATGLSYSSSVDSNGFGTYTIILDRSAITDGEYSNTLNFNLSDGEKVAIKIYYQVGTLRSRANIGKAWVVMYDASDDSVWGSGALDLDGSVNFTTTSPVAAGNYYIITSTDIDNDGTICDYGELCEYYPPISGTDTYFTVEEEQSVSGYEIFLKSRYRYGGENAASINSSDQIKVLNPYARKIDKSINNPKIIKATSITPKKNQVSIGENKVLQD